MKWILVGFAVLITIVAVIVTPGDTAIGQRSDFAGQGDSGPALADNGGNLVRSADGIRVRAVVPTPAPGSYEYPSGDMFPGWSSPHPEVFVGGPDEPEAFTMWAIIFNYPDLCTDDACDLDDLAPGAAAKGGIYQADGRIAAEDELDLAGTVRIGQTPATGSALEDPMGAEVHLAIAPHGKALPGVDGWRQLNGPLGNPTLWWAASFSAGG